MTATNTDALDLMCALVLEDGRRWGEAADPIQLADARAVLDTTSATPYHYETRARGWSKTADLAGAEIAVMLAQLPASSRLYALGADRDQGRLFVDSIAGFVSRTPELRGALTVDSYRVTAARSGCVLDVLPADEAGAWGLRPAFVAIDELAAWGTTPGPRRLFEAVTTAVAKIAGCRMAVLTTAGDPAHWARKVLDHAIADPMWRVHEVAGPPPWMHRDRLEEQRRRLPPSSFARLFENQWVAPEDRLVVADDLAACVTLSGPLAPERGRAYVIGLDVGIVNDRTVAVVAHSEPMAGEPRAARSCVTVDRIFVWAGSRANPVQLAEVGEWLRYTSQEYNRAQVVFDPHQAIDLTQRLSRAGVRVEKFDFTQASVGRLALALFEALRNRTLALPDDEDLLDELRNVRLREASPGTFRIDHDPDKHDDRVIALALAVQRLMQRGTPRPMRSYVSRARIPVRSGTRDELRELASQLGVPYSGGTP